MDNILCMMEFTQVLADDPKRAYDFISQNAHRLTKDNLVDILKEVLCSVRLNTNSTYYGGLYDDICTDVQVELDELYDESYQEYLGGK